MKYEWKKNEKNLYGVKQKPQLIEVPSAYYIMIKQPYFITKEIFELAFEKVKKKKPNELYDEISFDCIESKKAIQILHIGSFDTEIESFEKLDNFASEMNLERSEKLHTEIYLNNKNRTAEDKLKTILRYNVK